MWFRYWKNENKNDLYYLYKIVHNKTIYDESEFEEKVKKESKKEFNGFCTFVFNSLR